MHFFLPGILYKDRKTSEANICPVLWAPNKLCLLIALKPSLRSCSKPFRQVLGHRNGILQHVVSLLYCKEWYLCGCYRDDAVSPHILVGLPFDEHVARSVFSSFLNFFFQK